MTLEPFLGLTGENEQWRPVPGFEDRYEVSDFGRVRSLPLITRTNQPRPGRIKAQHVATTGYWQVTLYRDDRGYTRTVHRLVALAFHGEPQLGQQVRHLNGNPLDARACNLAWGTDPENKADIKRHGRNHNVNKTHCPQGHEYTPDNTILQRRPSGVGRRCRTCHRTRWRPTGGRADSASVPGHTLSPSSTHTSRGGSNTRRSSSTPPRFP